MPVVHGDVTSVVGFPLDGTLWVSSTEWRGGGSSLVSMNRTTYDIVDGHFETGDIIPGPCMFEFRGDGSGQVRRKSYEFIVPDEEGPMNFLDLLDTAYEYPTEVVGQAQQAAREARESADDAAASAAIVGSAENVLIYEGLAEGHKNAAAASASSASSSAGAASSSASAASNSATDSTAAAAAAHDDRLAVDSMHSDIEQWHGEVDDWQADVSDKAAQTAADRIAVGTARDVTEGYRNAAMSARDDAEEVRDDAVSARNAAQSAAATAATDAANGVLSQTATNASNAAQSASDAEDSANDAEYWAGQAEEVVGSGVPDAGPSIKGKIQLAGDLSGTAASPTVPGLAGKADVSHVHDIAEIPGLASALAGKVNTTSAGNRVYGTDTEGNQSTLTVAESASGGTVAVRSAIGTLTVADPTANGHAANKSYVDSKTNSRPALFSGEGAPPSSIPGAVVGDWWLDTETLNLYKITGV